MAPFGPEFELLKFIPQEESAGKKITKIIADATTRIITGLADREEKRQTKAGQFAVGTFKDAVEKGDVSFFDLPGTMKDLGKWLPKETIAWGRSMAERNQAASQEAMQKVLTGNIMGLLAGRSPAVDPSTLSPGVRELATTPTFTDPRLQELLRQGRAAETPPSTAAGPATMAQPSAQPPIAAPTDDASLVGRLIGATRQRGDLPEGISVTARPTEGVSITRQAPSPAEQTRRLLGEATRLKASPGVVQEAIAKAGLPLTPEIKDYLQGQSLLAYRRHFKAASTEGLRGPEAERQAARRAFEETGVLHPQIPSERYFASKEEEAQVAENYLVKELAAGRTPQDAAAHAQLMGFTLPPDRRNAIMERAFRTTVVARQEFHQRQGLTEPAAFRRAVQDAFKYTGGEGVPAEGPFAQQVIPEEAPVSADIKGQAFIRQGVKPSEITPGVARQAEQDVQDKAVIQAGREARVRLEQERGPAGVPERASAQEREQAAGRASAIEQGKIIRDMLAKRPDLIGGPLGIWGRINQGRMKIDAAPPEFPPFNAAMGKLRAELLRAMAGANIGPAERETYFETFPQATQSTQQFTANLNVTLDNIERLDTLTARIQQQSIVRPPSGAPTQLSPEGRAILDKYLKGR